MMRPLLRSSSARLAAAVAASFLLAIAILGTGIYFAVSSLLNNDAREVVHANADSLLAVYRTSGLAGLEEEIEQRTAVPDDPDVIYALADAQGNVVAGVPMPILPAPMQAHWLRYRDYATVDAPGVLAMVQPIHTNYCLLTGLRTRSQDGFLRMMLDTALLALLVAAVLGVLLGWGTSRWVSYRLRALDDTSARVGHGELALRVPRDGSMDAFDRLAQRFNAMLDRIEDLMQGIRHATDHIAHDLRTPLTRVRNRLDQLRGSVAGNDAFVRPLEGAIVDTDQLLHSFSALLRLSRIEAQQPDLVAPQVNLAALVKDALDLYAPVIAESGLALHVSLCAASVQGDADQLFQVMVNLLDNALKYAPFGGTLEVTLQASEQEAILEIADHGPGIAESERERVFDRFVRLQPERSSPGTGLGLSLVRAIVQRHRGYTELLDNAPGLRVRVHLPLA